MFLPKDDELYAEVTQAMESALEAARQSFPGLTDDDLFLALLLLKDRVLERHVDWDELSPPFAPLARRLYEL